MKTAGPSRAVPGILLAIAFLFLTYGLVSGSANNIPNAAPATKRAMRGIELPTKPAEKKSGKLKIFRGDFVHCNDFEDVEVCIFCLISSLASPPTLFCVHVIAVTPAAAKALFSHLRDELDAFPYYEYMNYLVSRCDELSRDISCEFVSPLACSSLSTMWFW